MPEPAGPPASSEPDQLTLKLALFVTAGSGATALVGRPASKVFSQMFVASGGFTSKMIEAWALIFVPVDRPGFWPTKKETHPCPSPATLSGGRKPTSGLLGITIVFGSMARNVHSTV